MGWDCGAANCSLIGQVCGGRDGKAADCGRCRLASRSPSLRPIWPANVWALIRFLQTASAVQHIVCFADFLKKINERYANDPKCGFLYERRNVAAPAAAAPAAEPSVESDESEKKKPKVSREKGLETPSVGFVFEDSSPVPPAAAAEPSDDSSDERPNPNPPEARPKRNPRVNDGALSSLRSAGIEIGIKWADDCLFAADRGVLVVREAVSQLEAGELVYDAAFPEYSKLGNQALGLRLLSAKGKFVGLLDMLKNVVWEFRWLRWPFAKRFEIRFYTFLATLPSCPAQDHHIDHTDVRVWSLIVCIGFCAREVRFVVDGVEFAVILYPGDAVLFRGDTCHFGGPSGSNHRCAADAPCRAEAEGKELSVSKYCVEFAMHCYVVVEMPELKLPAFDWQQLGVFTFPCRTGE